MTSLEIFPRKCVYMLWCFSDDFRKLFKIPSFRTGPKLTTRSELAGAAAALARVPFEDRIAVEPDFNNPVMLLGRPVLCGYEGHLWSHGLDYRRQWDALQVVLKEEPGWQETLKCLDAKWLYLKASPPFLIKIPRPDYSPNPRPASSRPISSR
jgi:hypothetical protein